MSGGPKITRCGWCESDALYRAYHDEEWGVPIHDDRKHFEFLVLESAQAGLSWITILRKRKAYREAFDGFDPIKVAAYDDDKIHELMQNPGIVRNRRKIETAVNNARRFLEVQKEFGSFDRYIWKFVGGKPIVGHYQTLDEIPSKMELSEAISRNLKKRGFRFLGPVIVYSYMQAAGLVNDHLDSCFRKNCCVSSAVN